jgi:ATP-binding cassette subfamily B protein/ATP-binding cassette subfamily C protein LapB
MNQKEIKNSLYLSYIEILKFYFGNIDSSIVEKLSAKKSSNFTHDDIISVSKELGLDSTFKKISFDEIESYMLPAIFCNYHGKDMIILECKNRTLILKNPYSKEKIVVLKDDFDSHNINIILFSKENKQHEESLNIGDQKSKKWFFDPIKESWRAYVEIGILTIFINIFGLAMPLFTMSVYNRVVPNFATETLFVLSSDIAIILVFDLVLKSARLHILEGVTKKISNRLEEELFQKVLSIQSSHDRLLVGSKINLFRELQVVKDFFSTKIIYLLDLPFFFLASFVIYLISPTIALVPIVFGLVILGLNFVMQYPIANLHKESFEESQSKHSFLVEQIQGSEAIKLSNALFLRVHKWRRLVNFSNYIQNKIQFLSSFTTFVSHSLLQSVSLVTIILGVYAIGNGELNVGGLIAISILANRAMVPIITLSSLLVKYKQVKEALDSLNEYWHLPTESDKYSELGIGRAKGKIEFNNVEFSYHNSKYASVQNCSFTINAGERVGIIGQTGAGKSTIQKLLTGIEAPTKGEIFLDDKNISTIHPIELRENISLMPQEPYLFSGTLKENLELSRNISKEEMNNLLIQTGLEELIKKSGMGDGFVVGEGGKNLSVGQRHLVALARALMSDSPILVLDEPTTGLDVGLEKKLVQHLGTTLHDKTLIVITHRFAALDLVDRLILINNGKIVADGKKEDILKMLMGKGLS